MARYIIKRVLQSIVVLLGVTAVVFFALNLTGDPVTFMFPIDTPIEVLEEYRRTSGMNDPILIQYGRFLWDALHGDFGTSHYYNQPALLVVMERLPATFLLAVTAFILALLIAVPTGILSAVKRNSVLDAVIRFFSMLGQCVPIFWLGLLLMLLFSVKLRLLPTIGFGSWKHLIMPALTLAPGSAASFTRLIRSGMLDVLGQDYITVARAKGIHNGPLIMKHAFKNSLSSVLTVLGLQLASLMGGSLITENIFSWPGVGGLMYNSILQRDFMVVEAGVCLIAAFFVFINLAVDILYAAINPRIRFE